ncbi:PREDICTED: IQ domain-containing protein G-like [Papilio xuthus]|uniref:Dynein regulatory complex protein 9 n=1 Tax=Papilio xuthus TaxID=66420 RepID=A0AAJ7E7W4_PAPXU|nr:PREDICTED: IQ domain-containing protein G-like [Papilio xuthus]
MEETTRLVDNSNHELITKRYLWEIQMLESDEKIASFKDQIRDATRNTKAKLCYAEKWINATAEAVDLRFQIKPKPLPNKDHELRIHGEIAQTYELETKEREELLEQWRTRYAEDTARISRHVTEQREKLRVTTARRLELQKLYDLHAGEMRAWLTFKRERAARLAREEHAKAAATRIQSWWRGLMVRRALGAFKHLRNSKKSAVKKKK